MTEMITPFNPALTMAIAHRSVEFSTPPRGLAKISNEINRQAAMIGYLNAFTMYAATSAFAVVLCLLVAEGRGRGEGGRDASQVAAPTPLPRSARCPSSAGH